MAIKVEHQGNVAGLAAGGAEGGRAKRAMEAAAFAKPTPVQTLSAAHASAPGAGAPSAPTISAPGGGAYAGLVGGGGGVGQIMRGLGGGKSGGGSSGAITPAGQSFEDNYKITGNDATVRPDDESRWDASRGQWIRKWLPGEKEAEALNRTLAVKNAYATAYDKVLGAHKSAMYRSQAATDVEKDAGIKLNTLAMAPKMKEQINALKEMVFDAVRKRFGVDSSPNNEPATIVDASNGLLNPSTVNTGTGDDGVIEDGNFAW